MVQYANFKNSIPLEQHRRLLSSSQTVAIGANPNTPQKTEQTKWQFRDDFSWSVTGMGGLGHDFKVGANWIHEPHLFADVQQRRGRLLLHASEPDERRLGAIRR